MSWMFFSSFELNQETVASSGHGVNVPPWEVVRISLLDLLLCNPNTDVAMYESDEIIKYLVPHKLVSLSSIFFPGNAFYAVRVSSRQASKDLGELKTQKRKRELYLKAGFCEQLSPFCKIVRERLVELELPHVYYNAARGSPKRNYLLERTGIFQVPFLEDPNTGVEMFESSEIIKYLNTTYAL
ncbi:uncharacterized protein LOC9640559 [Selaginella moellendorffii]|uniref:uncharacterized protein LOC9640559 n=1 Tax=Selaginella moellendorffii TaxID=88036 RepID=UPI000D1CD7DC|nr:uncharacterized protein LOC9640559 [Selaginella moellendorffii]|eukprot:XP_024515521.1 uncharacterized protein LOC9640559 [Selaginella moellendorffii]